MFIRNYGMFWRRDLVGPDPWPRTGQLLGVGVRKKKMGAVDFAQQAGIYALYDDAFRLIYVGQAGRGKTGLYKRLRSHTITNLSQRWSRFCWFGIKSVEESGEYGLILKENRIDLEFDSSVILDQLEGILIMAAEPLRNAQGGKLRKAATHYRQVPLGRGVEEYVANDQEEEEED